MGIQADRLLCDSLCEIDHGLTDWEVDFIEGIASQLIDKKRALTPAQRKMALEILEKQHD